MERSDVNYKETLLAQAINFLLHITHYQKWQARNYKTKNEFSSTYNLARTRLQHPKHRKLVIFHQNDIMLKTISDYTDSRIVLVYKIHRTIMLLSIVKKILGVKNYITLLQIQQVYYIKYINQISSITKLFNLAIHCLRYQT